MNYIIEIATTGYSTTKMAVEGGADRIELCASLVEGGITPSFGILKKCREEFSVSILPMIRPRGGDFLYSADEFQIMIDDVQVCKRLGFDGIVTGLLLEDGSIDVARTAQLVELAYPLDVVFHRAFDRCRDPFAALEQLIQIGCQCILSSGQKPTVPESMDLIKQLIDQANDRITIMPGSGIRVENIKAIAEKTGATEFHTSLRSKQKSRMEFVHPAFVGSEEVYLNPAIDEGGITALKNMLMK